MPYPPVHRRRFLFFVPSVMLGWAALLGGCERWQSGGAACAADVTTERLRAADGEAGNWMTHGRTYSEQRFSPLTQITDQNVAGLGLAWWFDLDTRRGQEATPLVIDGVMYFTSAWSKVFALNAATGAKLELLKR